jgi:hypothetical protein
MSREITKKELTTLRSVLRRAWSRWPARWECVKANSRPYVGRNKRRKIEVQCNICKHWWAQKEIQVDHVIPCGSLLTKEDILPFFMTLFFGEIQTVCLPCHSKKTKAENAARKKANAIKIG